MNFHVWIGLAAVILVSGCQMSDDSAVPQAGIGIGAYRLYQAKNVKISGLTTLGLNNGTDESRIEAYVDLLDEFNCRIKSPGVFRFELYEYVPRSSDPKGSRLQRWEDMELLDLEVNNHHWKDFLRSYYFDLPLNFDPGGVKSFSLQITFMTPEGKRISDTYHLEYK